MFSRRRNGLAAIQENPRVKKNQVNECFIIGFKTQQRLLDFRKQEIQLNLSEAENI